MVASAHGNPLPVEQLGYIVGMNAVHDKTDDAGLFAGRGTQKLNIARRRE